MYICMCVHVCMRACLQPTLRSTCTGEFVSEFLVHRREGLSVYDIWPLELDDMVYMNEDAYAGAFIITLILV